MKFKLRGEIYSVERDKILEIMRGEVPENATKRQKYYVRIGDEEYPIKQVIAKVIELSKVSFTAMDAYGILTCLGFEIIERTKEKEGSGELTSMPKEAQESVREGGAEVTRGEGRTWGRLVRKFKETDDKS